MRGSANGNGYRPTRFATLGIGCFGYFGCFCDDLVHNRAAFGSVRMGGDGCYETSHSLT